MKEAGSAGFATPDRGLGIRLECPGDVVCLRACRKERDAKDACFAEDVGDDEAGARGAKIGCPIAIAPACVTSEQGRRMFAALHTFD